MALVEDDATLAARLQAEELGRLGAFLRPDDIAAGFRSSTPLIERIQQTGNASEAAIILQNLSNFRQNSFRMMCLYCVVSVIEVVSSSVILGMSIRSSCDRSLKMWLLLLTFRHVIMLPIGALRYDLSRRRNPPPEIATRLFHIKNLIRKLNLVTFSMFLFGQYLLIGSRHCDPLLYRYSTVLVFGIYIVLLSPVLMCLGLLFGCRAVVCVFEFFTEPLGVADSFLLELPMEKFQETTSISSETKECSFATQCSVCITDYKEGDEMRILPCDHRFHKDCVDRWLRQKKQCPLCRHDVTEAICV
eukprot:71478_1